MQTEFLTDEHIMFREAFRRFVAAEITPHYEAWDEAGRVITGAIYDLVDELGGSFSAEHGVGRIKKGYLAKYRGGTEIALMRTLKKTLDPANTLNPGKVI